MSHMWDWLAEQNSKSYCPTNNGWRSYWKRINTGLVTDFHFLVNITVLRLNEWLCHDSICSMYKKTNYSSSNNCAEGHLARDWSRARQKEWLSLFLWLQNEECLSRFVCSCPEPPDKGGIFSCGVNDSVKDQIFGIRSFDEGSSPVRYLGVPSISFRLNKSLIARRRELACVEYRPCLAVKINETWAR